jgi:hypothetical protein
MGGAIAAGIGVGDYVGVPSATITSP